ncbi:MAG: PEP-utilizing enzyme [Proteobacteria bacterium]|nr:PEP-utilizing enzyme [Pseudomonadota bacterium]
MQSSGVKFFGDIKNPSVTELGGKGASLVKIIQAGFNVPNGFIIPATITDLNDADILLAFDQLDVKYVAVRSSAVAEDGTKDAWAGQLETYLNTTRENLLFNIQKCRESANSARAVAYCNRKGIEKTSVAVIVQTMVESEISGVAFSKNPIGGSESIVIEAGLGLGEATVSGKITPDNYCITKKSFAIKSKRISEQNLKLTRDGWIKTSYSAQKLSDEQILELARQVLLLEEFFGFPVDIEWAFANGKLYILQSRPITSTVTEYTPDLSDYELTFKMKGLPFMFADLLCRGFGYLHPLFVIDNGIFRQYFPNDMMKWAEDYGYNTFSNPGGFAKHQDDFTNFHQTSFPRLQKILTLPLSRQSVAEFLEIIYQYFIFYSKTDIQFTSKLYLQEETNPTIAQAMKDISTFKDIARVWIDQATINDDCLLNQLLEQVSQQFNISDISNYKMDEILGLFDGITPTGLSERDQSSVTWFDGVDCHYIFGNRALDFAKRINERNKMLAKSPVCGRVANRGQTQIVEGRARLISVDYSDSVAVNAAIKAMIYGEILVAKSTAPELVLACEKAKAIVADMGGMLSHAAIVSRELGIPCIVGTGNASHIIKTGDMIVLNMDTGQVDIKS